MPGFEQGDIVRVPFPYTDRATRQYRPALVVSKGAMGENGALLWVAMITSAENRPWPGDVALGDGYAEAGLPAPSVVRPCKLATMETRHAKPLGRLPWTQFEEVATVLKRGFGFSRAPSLQSTSSGDGSRL